MLTRSFLGEDEVWPIYGEPNEVYISQYPSEINSIPTVYQGGSVYQASYPASVPVNEGFNWSSIWGNVEKAIPTVTDAVLKIIRQRSGQPQPSNPNQARDKNGNIVQSSSNTWLIPALLIGGGAIYMMNRKKRRR